MVFSSEQLKGRARALGFNLVGIASAAPSPTLDAYLRWIDAGMHGDMGYMARPDRVARRRDLNVILPGVQSLVIVGVDYTTAVKSGLPAAALNDPARGRIASYAWGVDYHDILTPRLQRLAQWLGGGQYAVYVDTGALLERSHAQTAGLGFTGKNTMLIHPRRGSTFFLGELLTGVEFDRYDEAGRATMCGTCTRCLNACPTDAFPAPHVLDARRCISYHTIENKGWIDRNLRPQFGNWVFGCDVCQEVCPFQRFATRPTEAAFAPPKIDRAAPLLLDLLAMDSTAFKARYAGTPIYRIKRDRLVRNACIAAGNWRSDEAAPPLANLLHDTSPLVRGHAAWGLWRIRGDGARRDLTALYDREDNTAVRAEITALLG